LHATNDTQLQQRTEPLERIYNTLVKVAKLVADTDMGRVEVDHSSHTGPVTTLDKEINELIHQTLPKPGEGWLSEETRDDPSRLTYRRVWVVDPIDGTREFVEKIPEWCVSIGLVEGNDAVAGGVLNPSTGELFLGSRDTQVEVIHLNEQCEQRSVEAPDCVLVSRREHGQGKWKGFEKAPFVIQPVGSIAYRLARVAAGHAEATCTFEPRSEWDVAAGVALVLAAGGTVQTSNGEVIRFNKEVPKLSSFLAVAKECPPGIPDQLRSMRIT
jgi:myo-inositol-1(or 4)-monophosphatase